jgi:hypothetical protein
MKFGFDSRWVHISQRKMELKDFVKKIRTSPYKLSLKRKFEQRIPFPRKVKSKSKNKLNKNNKMTYLLVINKETREDVWIADWNDAIFFMSRNPGKYTSRQITNEEAEQIRQSWHKKSLEEKSK